MTFFRVAASGEPRAVRLEETLVECREELSCVSEKLSWDDLLAFGAITASEQRAHVRGHRYRMASTPPFQLQTGLAACELEEANLAILPQVEDDVVRRLETSVPDKEADQPEKRLGGNRGGFEVQRSRSRAMPDSCAHLPMGASEDLVRRAKAEGSALAAATRRH